MTSITTTLAGAVLGTLLVLGLTAALVAPKSVRVTPSPLSTGQFVPDPSQAVQNPQKTLTNEQMQRVPDSSALKVK